MILGKYNKLMVENRGPGMRVLRFIHPDLRDQVYNAGDIEHCQLFLDMKASALSYISEGEALIVNLGLVEHFPSVLYSILLKVREIITAHRGCVILCGANTETREILDLFKASRLFAVTKTERQALGLAAQFNGHLLPMDDSQLSGEIPAGTTR
jgi:anti-anti-sigma regulatory factor